MSSRSENAPGWNSWAALALAAGTALFLLRASFHLLGFGRIPLGPRSLEAWHLALTLGQALPFALAAGALCAAAALRLRRVLGAVVCAAISFVALTGWPLAAPGDLPDPSTGAGRLSLAVLAVASLVLGALLVVGRPAPLRIAALVAVLVPAGVLLAFGLQAPRRDVRETARELLADSAAWTVVASRPDAPPQPGVLTPSLDWTVDGGDLASLVMPPPCEVRFTVGKDVGPAFLRASAGVDRRLAWQFKDAPADCAVEFQIDVNGERRFGARIPGPDPASRRAWHPAGGRRGIAVQPGDTVSLRTALTHPDAPIFGDLPLQAGFGRLELERAVERPYRRPSAEEPSVLLIVMDTLRADHLTCYGASGPETAALDALAERGVLYEKGYATSSWTWPSTASILTGLPPEAHGVLDEHACFLDGELDTLAEVLRDRDLATAAFVCNPILDPGKNFDQGFETYDYSRDFRMSGEVVGDVATWIDQHRDVRFFLYLHLVDPHHPVDARPEDFDRAGVSRTPPPGSPEQPLIEYGRRLLADGPVVDGRVDPDPIVPKEHQDWIRGAYRAGVLSADHWVGEVLRALDELGLDESTIVVFTSDHGEELFDHGLLGHGTTLYQELVRVPLIVAGPGVPRGVRVATPVTNQSLFRALAERCGADAGAVPEAVDLLDPSKVDARPIHFTTEKGWWWNAPRGPMHGTLEGTWVLHLAPKGLPWGAPAGADPGEGQARLFDLDADPRELADRSAQRSDLSAAMRAKIAEHARAWKRERARELAGAGEGTLDLLRRIGYTGDDK